MADILDTLYNMLGKDESTDSLLNSLHPDVGYGKRVDGTNKQAGYFGELPNKNGGVSTELSIGVNLGGEDREIPLIVPTLNKEELDTVLSVKPGEKLPNPIIDKAVDHAVSRLKQNKSPFAGFGENKYKVPE